jgi:hypothetical protein
MTISKNQTLQYYMHDGPTAFRFELSGHLNREGAQRLDQDWRTAMSVIGDRRLIVDITFVSGSDEQGRALLARWHREGARFVANSKASCALAESIIGEPLPARGAGSSSDRTWLPFFRVARTANFPSSARQLDRVPASLSNKGSAFAADR